jgi:hypothetical protein
LERLKLKTAAPRNSCFSAEKTGTNNTPLQKLRSKKVTLLSSRPEHFTHYIHYFKNNVIQKKIRKQRQIDATYLAATSP